MEEDTAQSPNPTSMDEEDSTLPCLPNPPVPPDFLPSMIKFDLQSQQGNVLDLASKKLLVSRFIMKKISCYPNIQHIRSDQLEVTHFCEQLIVYMKLRFSHVAVSPKLTASNNYGISPMIPIPYDFFHTCFVYYKGLALSSLRNNFSATPQYSRCISTGLSRIPIMPYPPVPLAFMHTILPLLSSEHNILVVQWGLNQTIQRILSFYPNLQYSPMDQLTVYHYFESVMEYYKEGRMLTPARKRLMCDLKRLEQDSLAGIGGAPLDNDFRLWNAVISGPDDTPWSGGTFKLTLQFSEDYPHKPPTVRFISRMFHPNIYADGSMRLDILHNQWNPRYDVATILTSIRSLLCDPNANCPANSEAARLFSENQDDYNRKVREIVEQSRWTAD